MAKQIILHYAGSYVERPHTITFDSEGEYEDFLQNKGYRLKPNVEYGVYTLDAILNVEFQQSSISIKDVNKNDKPDISNVTPPTIGINPPSTSVGSGAVTTPSQENGSDVNDSVIII
ncbi:hypothetical protein [Campylobacter devanensis]|uniref:hypothetical protein n=1 Tax=Campylobacter devanensis TaxID=3161138 RepID=UPI000A357D56|nr:hypothetical protein [Campylobacter sp. P0227]